jgi:excisionase family DNA binding protein
MNLLTYREAAEKLHVHPSTVARLVQSGKLPVHRVGRNTPRIASDALEAFLRAVKA